MKKLVECERLRQRGIGLAGAIVVVVIIGLVVYGIACWSPTIWESVQGPRKSEPRLLWTYQTEGSLFYPPQVAISSNGDIVAATGGYEVYVLSPDGALQWEYHTPGYTSGVTLSADGNYLAVSTEYGRKLLLFNRTSSTPLWTSETTNSVSSVAMSSDGSRIVVGHSFGDLHILTPSSNQPLWTHWTADDVAISADGNYIVACESMDKLRLFDNTGNVIYETFSEGNEGWRNVEISLDGRYIVAAASYATDVYLFSSENSTPLWTFDSGLIIEDIAISENGDYIVVAAGSKIFMFSRSSSTPLWNANVGTAPTIAMSADGEYVVVGDQEGLKLFSRLSNVPVWEYEVTAEVYGYSYSVASFKSVAISTDGSYFVGGGSDGKVYFFSKA